VAEGQADTTTVVPWLLRIGDQAAGAKPSTKDDRIPLRGYVDMKLLVDPLCKRVDLNDPTSWIYSSYALWYGYGYKGQEGMTKIGNRLTWVDSTVTHRLNWLITDADNFNPPSPGWTQGSHPDRLGFLHNMAIEGGGKDNPNPTTQVNNQTATETNSKWVWWAGWDRGEIEMNAGAADGSVTRYNDVRTYNDDRMARAPTTPAAPLTYTSYPARDGRTATVPSSWINVPIQ
jgi:hypothetical protein